jgi:hypothetical protein
MIREVHICNPDGGHVQSHDCWCEPARVYWVMKDKNTLIHVTEHNEPITALPPWVSQVLGSV